MDQRSKSLAAASPAMVSHPGGFARQFRVQFRSQIGQPWRLYGSFRDCQQAEQCVTRLHDGKLDARVIRFDICPTAV